MKGLCTRVLVVVVVVVVMLVVLVVVLVVVVLWVVMPAVVIFQDVQRCTLRRHLLLIGYQQSRQTWYLTVVGLVCFCGVGRLSGVIVCFD